MGLAKWFARRGSIGGTARAVAKAWRVAKEQNPEKSAREIAEAYVAFRYGITGEFELAEEVYAALPYDVSRGRGERGDHYRQLWRRQIGDGALRGQGLRGLHGRWGPRCAGGR